MEKELNQEELEVTKKIINIGLSKAADTLSFFIKEKAVILLFDLKVNSYNNYSLSKKDNIKKSYLLTTEIRGEIGGKAFLVFNESEVEKLVDVNFPDTIKNNPQEKAAMTDAILLEIDNIITASVVTQFANILKCKIFGDVPALAILPPDELNSYLSTNNMQCSNIIYFNSRFITKNLDINPEFIWVMDDTFFMGVKNLASNKEKIELLEKLK